MGKRKSTVLWRSRLENGAADRWNYSNLFFSPSRSLPSYFSFLFLFLSSLFSPCLVRFPDLTSRRPREGRRRKALLLRASDSRSPSLPHSPQSQGGGQPLPWHLARVSVSDSLDDWTRASVSPLGPRPRVPGDPGPLGSVTSVFYFNEGTWPLGLAFLVSHSRGANLR